MEALFIANKNHLSSKINGGVQLCTNDFIELFKTAGFELLFYPVSTTKRIIDRVKIKLKIDSYNTYDPRIYVEEIFELLYTKGIKYVILNQVNLMQFGYLIKNKFKDKVKLIVLSHGNESGDFIHSLVREKNNRLKKITGIWKLGRLMYKESNYFTYIVDYLLVISELEKSIDHWLGTNEVMFVPRVLKENIIERNPVHGRFGFIATLNHPPNKIGLEKLCSELQKINPEFQIRLIGAPNDEGEKFQKRFKFIQYLGHLNDSEVEKEIKSWSYFLNPVFWYSRGASTKLAFALERGIPVISTPAGNRGYLGTEGTIVTVKGAAAMAKVMSDIYNKEIGMESDVKGVIKSGPTYHHLSLELKEFLGVS